MGLRLRCLATVPRLRSHQHQKLQSSSYCFHCSTTCSPTHSHVHTHTRALTHSVTTPTSVSPNPLLLLSLLLLSLSLRGSPPYFSFSLSPSLHPPSLRSTRALTTQPNSRCCSQGAVCSSTPDHPPSCVHNHPHYNVMDPYWPPGLTHIAFSVFLTELDAGILLLWLTDCFHKLSSFGSKEKTWAPSQGLAPGVHLEADPSCISLVCVFFQPK